LFGNYFLYRKEANNPETVSKYTPDYQPDVLDKVPVFGFGAFLGMGVFMLMFGWAWGAAAWAAHVVLYIVVNAMVNGLGHVMGYRNFENQATNLQWLALISAGEGLHNNHHEYPTSARLSVRGREFDPAWPVIRMLEILRLAEVQPESLAQAA
jgi:stearoyl-CoA desaturase (delta-9 desaturase)